MAAIPAAEQVRAARVVARATVAALARLNLAALEEQAAQPPIAAAQAALVGQLLAVMGL